VAAPNLPTSITANVTTGEVADTIKAYGILNKLDTLIGTGATTGDLLRWDGTLYVKSSALNALPAGATLTVIKSGGGWPARPTSRADIIVQWKGADPSPSIVSSGTGGMLDNVDIRLITT
jgi:hypothetical protein